MKKTLLILGMTLFLMTLLSHATYAGCCWVWDNNAFEAKTCTDGVASLAACSTLAQNGNFDSYRFYADKTCADGFPGVPALSPWGIVALVLILGSVAVVFIRRRRVTA
jgi:hypothetical protein